MGHRMVEIGVVALLGAFLAACGASGPPAEGVACATANERVCESGTSALVCDDNAGLMPVVRGETHTWKRMPCAGPAGCAGSTCDETGNAAGDLCPLAESGQSFCKAGDPNVMLMCTDHKLVAMACPNGCAMTNGTTAACN